MAKNTTAENKKMAKLVNRIRTEGCLLFSGKTRYDTSRMPDVTAEIARRMSVARKPYSTQPFL